MIFVLSNIGLKLFKIICFRVFYAKDLSENIGSSEDTVVVELEEIPGYDTLILIGLIGVITIIIIKLRFKQIKTKNK